MIKEQKGVVFVTDPRRDRTAQLYTCALHGNLGLDHFGDASKVIHAV
jgi:hypothetical protein